MASALPGRRLCVLSGSRSLRTRREHTLWPRMFLPPATARRSGGATPGATDTSEGSISSLFATAKFPRNSHTSKAEVALREKSRLELVERSRWGSCAAPRKFLTLSGTTRCLHCIAATQRTMRKLIHDHHNERVRNPAAMGSRRPLSRDQDRLRFRLRCRPFAQTQCPPGRPRPGRACQPHGRFAHPDH